MLTGNPLLGWLIVAGLAAWVLGGIVSEVIQRYYVAPTFGFPGTTPSSGWVRTLGYAVLVERVAFRVWVAGAVLLGLSRFGLSRFGRRRSTN